MLQVQADDVSHLLLLNKRNTGVEPALFAAELEKFRPYQQRLSATVHHQELALQELGTLWKNLKDLAGRGAGARKWDDREKRKKDTVRRFSRARDVYMEIRDGLAYVFFMNFWQIRSFCHRKGLQFYSELFELTSKLLANTRKFVSARTVDRDALIAKLETERRYSTAQAQSPPPKPPLPPPPSPATRLPTSQTPVQSLESSFATMKIGTTSATQPPQGQQPQWLPPPPKPVTSYNPQPQRSASIHLPAPPVPPPNQYQSQSRDPYASIGFLDSQKIPTSSYTNGSSSQHQRSVSAFPPPPPPPPEQPRHSYSASGQYGLPPPPPQLQQPYAQQYQPPPQPPYGAPPPTQYLPQRSSQYTNPPAPAPGQPNQGGNWPGFWQNPQPHTGYNQNQR
jgi:tyrosine-protein phosphatase non-receptor type 23